MPLSDLTPKHLAKFLSRIDRSGGPDACWPWTGYCGTHGYGRLTVSYRDNLTHRLAWELAYGSIPDGMWVLHRCDNPPCCNPAHLWLGTNQDNTADRERKGRGLHGELPHYFGADHWSQHKPEFVRRGERHPFAKLAESDVRLIRQRVADGETDLNVIAADYAITHQAIRAIVKRKNWRHVL